MKRAVAIEVGDIGGPYHGIFSPSGRPRSAAASAARLYRQRASRSAGSTWPPLRAAVSTEPVGSAIASSTSASQAALSVAAATDASSVQARWAIWCATSQPAAGVGVRQPASSRPATSRVEPVALGGEVGEHGLEDGVWCSRGLLEGGVQGARPLVEDAAATGAVVADGVGQPEPADQVESGLDELARRRGATRRRRAARRCAGAPRGRGAAPAARRPRAAAASVRAATQSSSAAVNTGPVKWSSSIASTARVRRRPVGRPAAAASSSAPAHLAEVGDRRDHQVVLGREVVQLRAPADPGPLR